MKTEDLYLEYARVIKMCEGTKVKPWECVKHVVSVFGEHPNLKGWPNDYEFAIAILEDNPVFVGDTLFNKVSGNTVTVNHAVLFSQLSWVKPEPKRTFTLSGVELPCPYVETHKNERFYLKINDNFHWFSTEEDMDNVFNFISCKLECATVKS